MGAFAFGLGYGVSAGWNESHEWLFTIFSVNSLLLLLWNRWQPFVIPVRRMFGICNDMVATSVGLHLMDVDGLGLVSIYLFVTHGNAFRFGEPYFWISFVASVVGILWVWQSTPFWLSHTTIAMGALLSVLIVPIYTALLLRKVRHSERNANIANSSKSRLIASISHEMRTSLAAISGGTDLLMVSQPSHAQEELLNVLATSSRALNTLIQDVLDLSKIEQQKIEIVHNDFDLHELVSSIGLLFHGRATGRTINLDMWVNPNVNPYLHGDAPRVRQVLINLVGNAIKFTPDGGTVTVYIEPGMTSPTSVLFQIADTGIGIPANVQSRIFDAFTQGDQSTTRKYGGSGLGTTIAKQLVELMGGRIWFHSRENEGATFYFEVPLPRCQATQTSQERTAPISIVFGSDAIRDAIKALPPIATSDPIATLIPLSALNMHPSLRDEARNATTIILDQESLLDDLMSTIQQSAENHLDCFPIIFTQPTIHICKRISPALTHMPFDPELWTKQARFNRAMLWGRVRAESKAESSPLNQTDRTRGRILLAEDNPLVQRVTAAILRSHGHEVILANNGRIGLELLQMEKFDIAIVDYHMPEMDGMDLIKAYRAHEQGPALPIIMLTASVSKETAALSLFAGATRFIMKPYNSPELLSVVNSLINKAPSPAPFPENSTKKDAMLFDPSRLRDLINLGTPVETIVGMIKEYRINVAALLDELASPGAQLDASLKLSLHTLAGLSGTFGGEQLANYCRRLSSNRADICAGHSTINAHVMELANATLREIDRFEIDLTFNASSLKP